jgi:hypothetical protein
VGKKIHNKTLHWLSYKQLCDKHGSQEANGLISAKAVLVRQHPRCPDFFQFLDEDEQHSVSTEKLKELQVEQNQAIKTKEYKKLVCALRGTSMDASDFEGQLGKPFDSDDEGEDGDEEGGDDGYLPKALRDLMGEKKKKKKDKEEAEPVKDVDTLTAAPGDPKNIIIGKAKKMIKLLEQVPAGPHADTAKKNIAMLKKQVGYKCVEKDFLLNCAKLYKKCCKTS